MRQLACTKTHKDGNFKAIYAVRERERDERVMLSLAPFLQLTNEITEIGAIVDEDPPNKAHVRETRIRGGVTFGCFLPCPWTHPSLISYNHSVS